MAGIVGRYTQVVNGHVVPKYPMTEYTEEALNYAPHDGDIILTSFQKTGTTWLSYTVQQIAVRGDTFPDIGDMIYSAIPIMQLVGTEKLDALADPRIYRHHFKYDWVQKNPKSKVLYIHRHPEDVFASYFKYYRGIDSLFGGDLSFEQTFEEFVSGRVGNGCYFEHVLSFLEHETNQNMFIISYEEMLADPRAGILKIARFMGEDYYQTLVEHPSALEKVMNNTSFKHMKEKLIIDVSKIKHVFNREVVIEPHQFDFFRKGESGSGKATLTEQMRMRLKDRCEHVFTGTPAERLIEQWYKKTPDLPSTNDSSRT